MKLFVPASEATVLDAGCATGDFLAIAKKKYQVHGFDLSEFAVSEARRTNPDIAGRISVRNIGKPRHNNMSKFNAICLWDVIEHLWNPVEVCQNLALLLKPGGYFFISTPDIGSFMARILGRHWAFMTPPEHMGFFSTNSFSYLFGKALPFRIEYSKSFGKWTNLGFMIYKLRRIFPSMIPESLVKLLQQGRAGMLPIYAPTKDIRYLVAQKI
jgi:SAM-dependent methyltransferase